MDQAQAAQLRIEHDRYARLIWRKPVRELKDIYRTEQAARGAQLLYGGPSGKDELTSAIVSLRFPVEQLNESTHVLHHGDGNAWSACQWCHPHGGAGCDCPLGRTS